jgi:hypothetical protein
MRAPSTRSLLLSTTALLTCAPLAQVVDMPVRNSTWVEQITLSNAVEVRPGVFRLEAS